MWGQTSGLWGRWAHTPLSWMLLCTHFCPCSRTAPRPRCAQQGRAWQRMEGWHPARGWVVCLPVCSLCAQAPRCLTLAVKGWAELPAPMENEPLGNQWDKMDTNCCLTLGEVWASHHSSSTFLQRPHSDRQIPGLDIQGPRVKFSGTNPLWTPLQREGSRGIDYQGLPKTPRTA